MVTAEKAMKYKVCNHWETYETHEQEFCLGRVSRELLTLPKALWKDILDTELSEAQVPAHLLDSQTKK